MAATFDEAGEREATRPRLFAGTGTGKPCDVCGKPITRSDIEYELEFPNGAIVLTHVDCYERALEHPKGIGGGSADSPWTMLFDRQIASSARGGEVALSEFLIVCREAMLAARETRRRAAAVRAQSRAALGHSRHLRK